jgi:hypothetical protein
MRAQTGSSPAQSILRSSLLRLGFCMVWALLCCSFLLGFYPGLGLWLFAPSISI